MHPIEAPTAGEIRAARDRIASVVSRTPLLRLREDVGVEVYLKLENLQPTGSFKVRGATNAIRSLPADALVRGVWTASAGNMAQGVALGAREAGVPCQVVVPSGAPLGKLSAIERLGAEVIVREYEEWWNVLMTHECDGVQGSFIHPVANSSVVAGNATVALELVEELPDISAVFVPYGGGGLSCGIAAAMRHLAPRTQVIPVECSSAAPFAASLAEGRPVAVPHVRTFVDGIGGRSVLREMWPLASTLMSRSSVVDVRQIADAVRLLAIGSKVVAEGAGAAPVAAVLAECREGRLGAGDRVVCVVSGGNLDADVLAAILGGALPAPADRTGAGAGTP